MSCICHWISPCQWYAAGNNIWLILPSLSVTDDNTWLMSLPTATIMCGRWQHLPDATAIASCNRWQHLADAIANCHHLARAAANCHHLMPTGDNTWLVPLPWISTRREICICKWTVHLNAWRPLATEFIQICMCKCTSHPHARRPLMTEIVYIAGYCHHFACHHLVQLLTKFGWFCHHITGDKTWLMLLPTCRHCVQLVTTLGWCHCQQLADATANWHHIMPTGDNIWLMPLPSAYTSCNRGQHLDDPTANTWLMPLPIAISLCC